MHRGKGHTHTHIIILTHDDDEGHDIPFSIEDDVVSDTVRKVRVDGLDVLEISLVLLVNHLVRV